MRAPSATRALLVMAAFRLVLQTLTNSQYGFHRDELATLDDARHLDWGFVAYPPLTPFLARLALEFLGSTPAAVRFVTAVIARTASSGVLGPIRTCVRTPGCIHDQKAHFGRFDAEGVRYPQRGAAGQAGGRGLSHSRP